MKMCINVYKDNNKLLNLPRFIWIKKSWTLKELHMNYFEAYRDIFVRWYREEAGQSKYKPMYKHPDTMEPLNFETLTDLFENAPLEK